MSDSKVIFEGAGPYSLPTVQTTSVRQLGDSVEITLYAAIEGYPAPRPMVFQMAPKAALRLAEALNETARKIETNKK